MDGVISSPMSGVDSGWGTPLVIMATYYSDSSGLLPGKIMRDARTSSGESEFLKTVNIYGLEVGLNMRAPIALEYYNQLKQDPKWSRMKERTHSMSRRLGGYGLATRIFYLPICHDDLDDHLHLSSVHH